MIRELLHETRPGGSLRYFTELKEASSGRAMLEAERETQLDLVVAASAALSLHDEYPGKHTLTLDQLRSSNEPLVLSTVLWSLLRKKLPWTADHMVIMWRRAQRTYWCHLKQLLTATKNWLEAGNTCPPSVVEELDRLSEWLSRFESYQKDAEYRTVAQRVALVKALAAGEDPSTQRIKVPVVDAWTQAFEEKRQGGDDAWEDLIRLWSKTSGSKPAARDLKQAKGLLTRLGPATFAGTMRDVFAVVGNPFHAETEESNDGRWVRDASLLNKDHANLLRGLVWTCAGLAEPRLNSELGAVADRCYQKVKGVGPRNVKVGNACVWVLANHGGMEGVAEVNRLLGRVKHGSVRKQIEKTLNAAAEKHGLTREDLDDLAVPDCSLTGVGVRRQAFGDYEAELSILSGTQAQTVWHTPQGKTQKTVPKAVKDGFADELKALKADDKKLKQALQGQRDRLERVFLHSRTWSYARWKQRLLDHPLMGWLARRLIWSFVAGGEVVAGAWHDGQLVDAHDTPITPWLNREDLEVGLWHPVDATTESVAAWREWLIRHEVTQPIKQAHREVYLLTDAERETRSYSNRFAAHIIRQHQFHALCQARGWSYQLQGNWDGGNTPEKVIPGCDLCAEFWVDYPGETATSDAGIWMLLSTDQVRFYECDPREPSYVRYNRELAPVPLEQVPPRVFTEVLRDVDLFVAVSSVGADPNWLDQEQRQAVADYWQAYSFGELGHTAATRKEVLERLVPRLKIAARCSFTGKFLVVRGDVRTYKIHLGSGNILMEPNDQYLCIVPGRSNTKVGEKVYLPFEGDHVMSVILSKAFMLADDHKIKDPTILSQIKT